MKINMKKEKKYFIFIVLIGILFIPISCYANNTAGNTSGGSIFSNFWEDGKAFIDDAEAEEQGLSTDLFSSEMIPVIRIMVSVGYIILAIAILVIGIKYMVSTPQKKADLKQKLIGVLVATAILAGAYTIWNTVYNFMLQATRG